MAGVEHNLHCRECGADVLNILVVNCDYGFCKLCGGPMTWTPKSFHTDVYGAPKYSDATGQTHSSHRDKVRHMRSNGFDEAGDKVHGARPEHRLTHASFSYPKQSIRRTQAEGR